MQISEMRPTAGSADRGLIGATERADNREPDSPRTHANEPVFAILRREAASAPAGWRLGSETDLLSQFRVARSTLRQALRKLEEAGVARMRPGPHGGLYTCPRTYLLGAASLGWHLSMAGLRHMDLLATSSKFYEHIAVRAAANPKTEAERAGLEDVLAQYLLPPNDIPTFLKRRHQLFEVLAVCAKDPAAALFQQSLEWIQREIVLNELPLSPRNTRRVRTIKALDRRVVRAVLADDSKAALRRVRLGSSFEAHLVGDSIAADRLPSLAVVRTPFASKQARDARKLARLTSAALQGEITNSNLQPGHRMGTITSLASRFGVCADIMREALDLAAAHGLVRLRVGRAGGVFVGRLSDTDTVEAATTCLRDVDYDFSLATSLRSKLLGWRQSSQSRGVRTAFTLYIKILDQLLNAPVIDHPQRHFRSWPEQGAERGMGGA